MSENFFALYSSRDSSKIFYFSVDEVKTTNRGTSGTKIFIRKSPKNSKISEFRKSFLFSSAKFEDDVNEDSKTVERVLNAIRETN